MTAKITIEKGVEQVEEKVCEHCVHCDESEIFLDGEWHYMSRTCMEPKSNHYSHLFEADHPVCVFYEER